MIFDSNENFYISESYRQDILFWLNGGTSGTRVAGNGKKSNKDYYKNSFVIEFYYIKMNNVTVCLFFCCTGCPRKDLPKVFSNIFVILHKFSYNVFFEL